MSFIKSVLIVVASVTLVLISPFLVIALARILLAIMWLILLPFIAIDTWVKSWMMVSDAVEAATPSVIEGDTSGLRKQA